MARRPTAAGEAEMASDTEKGLEGRCLCGAVRFRAMGAPNWVAHCHCESCRRATSSPFTTYVGYQAQQVVWSGETRTFHESSPGVQRSFCERCGSPMSFGGAHWPGEIHLFLASFEIPEALRPQAHVHVGEQLNWVHLNDGLPRFHASGRDDPPIKTPD
jgi:hypothetical protein